MTSPDRQQRIAALRDTIADIERKPALAEARVMVRSEAMGFPLPAGGLLQEVFTDERRHAGRRVRNIRLRHGRGGNDRQVYSVVVQTGWLFPT